MEKKSIGSFISALRKANGLTQKELAEKLNVSDKTVSRWETGESAPDLSLIPVIAEIFDVTCDELLCGERKVQSELPSDNPVQSQKADKQRKMMLRSALSKYRGQTYISMCIAVVGLIAALICNLAFLRGVLGFLVGTVFICVAVVCQAVFINRALFSVDDDEAFDGRQVSEFRHDIVKLAELSFGADSVLFGFIFPMVLVDAYVGLSAGSMLLFGCIGVLVMLAVFGTVCYFLNSHFLRVGVYELDEREYAVYSYNHKLKRICALVFVGAAAVTFIIHQSVVTIWGPYSIMEGTVFNDYESFIAYMETPVPYTPPYTGRDTAVAEVASPHGEVIYYDEDGNEISYEEHLRRTIEDIDGTVLCEYMALNESVCSIRYGLKEGSALPITVCTYEDLADARAKVEVRNVIFCVIYAIEVVGAFTGYFILRRKK